MKAHGIVSCANKMLNDMASGGRPTTIAEPLLALNTFYYTWWVRQTTELQTVAIIPVITTNQEKKDNERKQEKNRPSVSLTNVITS